MKTTSSPSNFWRNFGLLFGVTALWLPLSMMFNSLQSLVLPVFVLKFVPQEQKATVLGLILFVGLSLGALVQPLVGIYADRRAKSGGTRQPVVILGALLTLAFLAGFALSNSVWLLAVAYVGISAAAGIAQAGYQGLLPDFVPASLRGNAGGLKGFLELLGSVLGFSIAGVLIKKGQPGGVVIACGILLGLGVLLVLGLVREGARRKADEGATDAAHAVVGSVTTLAQQAAAEPAGTGQGTSLTSPFARVLIARFFFMFAAYGVGHFLLFYVRDRLQLGASSGAGITSAMLTIFTVVTALVALSGGALSDRVGRVPALWLAGGTSALGLLIFIPASSIAVIYIGGIIMSVGSGLFASANWALAADLTPRGGGGRVYGMLAVATGGAAALAGLLGPLVDAYGYNPLFLIGAAAFTLSTFLLPGQAAIAQATAK